MIEMKKLGKAIIESYRKKQALKDKICWLKSEKIEERKRWRDGS